MAFGFQDREASTVRYMPLWLGLGLVVVGSFALLDDFAYLSNRRQQRAPCDFLFPSPRDEEYRPMRNDPRRIIVTESRCPSCSVNTVHVHHQDFPELRVEALSAERAAGHLANRLQAALDTVSDPSHREAIVRALADSQAFLNREGFAHPGRDVSGPLQS